MDYEFRFYTGPAMEALHITAVESDSEALERARAYLRTVSGFSHVEVRRGFHFMRRIDKDFIPGEVPPETL
jgi:hypothetical protein